NTTHQTTIPIPLTTGVSVSRSVNTGKTPARLNKALHGNFLGFVQNVASGIDEDQGIKTLEIFVGKYRGSFGSLNGKTVLVGQFLHGFHTSRDGVMAPARGFAEYQHMGTAQIALKQLEFGLVRGFG